MTAFTSSGTGNWSDPTKWSGGSGSDYPGSAGAGDTVVIGAHTITLDATAAAALASNSLVSITASSASAVLSIGANVTITFTGSPGIAYSGTNTSGFIRSGSGVTLTLVGPGSGTLLSNTSSGYAIVLSGTGALNLSNSGGTAISATAASGRGISSTSSGAIDIIGDVSATGSGCSGIRQGTSNNTIHVHGTMSGFTNAYAVELVTVCTCLLDGDMGGATGGLTGSAVYLDSATVTWTGSRSVLSGQSTSIIMISGTLNLTDLTLSVSGNFILVHNGGTVTTTNAVIRRQVAGANAILRGKDIATTYSLTVTEPVIPAAGDVDSTSGNFGFAGTPVIPTLTLPAVGDVESGVQYGAGGTEFTGTLVAGSGLIADYPDEADVRAGVTYGYVDDTTGTGTGTGTSWFEGTLTLPAEADVRDTVGYGAGGTEYTGAMTSGSDWTAAEREQIRYRLGIDGDETAPSTNTPSLGSIGSDWTDTEKSHIRYRLGIDGTEAAPTNTPTLGTVDANLTEVNGVPVTGVAAAVDANMVQISGDSAAADALEDFFDDATSVANLKAAYDGTGYAGGTIKQKVDLDTIKTQTITCAAGVTIGVYVGGTGAAALASEVTAARMGALTDWINGGRLDLILDAILDDTGTDGVVVAAGSKTGYTATLANGAHGGAAASFQFGAGGTITNADGTALTIQSTGNNGHGILINGNVNGHGISVSGGIGLTSWDIYCGGNGDREIQNMITNYIDPIALYVDCLPETLVAAPTASQVSTQVASDLATAHGVGSWATATSVTVSDKTGFKLASDGLDSISATNPTGRATTFREKLLQVWMKFFNKSTLDASQLKVYADDGTTVVTTQSVSDLAGTETQGPAT